MLVSLIVKTAGQADLSTFLINAEQAAGVDKQAVADWLLLERQCRSDQKAGEEIERDVTTRMKGQSYKLVN